MHTTGTDINIATALLQSGELVSIPTETVYGLGANALNTKAIARVFEAKKRPAFDPLILHFHNKDQISDYVIDIPKVFYKLYNRFSPGPITYILKKSPLVSDLITAGHKTVAVRFPKHPLCQKLLKQCNFPVAAPSANLFGRVSPTKAEHVAEQLSSEIAYILDGGECAVGLESTIIDLSEGHVKVLRLGGLALEEIEAELEQKIKTQTSSSNPKAPGMLSAHYSPGIKLLYGNLTSNLKLINPQRTGVIALCKKVSGIPDKNQRLLSPTCDLREAASELFQSLRSFNTEDVDVILAEEFPNEGLGRAINDRLKRASVK